ncbi:uncharacterized protein [Coffea arabica]|uniref:Protein JINGUBANG-like n=1 Tax=Coffea arabica TaxID=13443 RepID=A0ABM4U1P1_COFAR
MASLDSPRPDNIPSLAIRTQAATNKFSRSISHKEASFAETPPRLSSTSLSPRLYLSQPSSPRLSFKQDHDLHTIYRCISSVLKKDGQILSIAAASNGLVYTGSQGSIIRIWRLPDFAECGQLKSKANMVVSLQVSNDKVYAAYADCKIRVWHRTWEGAVKHVRVATIPKPGGYVRSYITGKDKMRCTNAGNMMDR